MNKDKLKAKVEAELDVSPMTVLRHLEGMGKVKKLEKGVPTDRGSKACLSHGARNGGSPFLNRIVTRDEKRIP